MTEPAREITARVPRRAMSAREACQAALDRAARRNLALNAAVTARTLVPPLEAP